METGQIIAFLVFLSITTIIVFFSQIKKLFRQIYQKRSRTKKKDQKVHLNQYQKTSEIHGEIKCIKCSKNTGKKYKFFFGKLISTMTYQDGIETKVDFRYHIGGSLEFPICDFCIRKYRTESLSSSIKYALYALGGLLIICLLGISKRVIAKLLSENFVRYFALLSLVILVPAIFVGFLLFFSGAMIFTSNEEIGSTIGIEIKSQRLEKKGYDTFWTPKKYARLKS